MAKQGMKRPDEGHDRPRNVVPPVPELQGHAKHSKQPANPIIAGTKPPAQKVYHAVPHAKQERPISEVYAAIDTDLARDNLENDIPDADLQDL